MSTDAHPVPETLPGHERQRRALVVLVRSVLVSTTVVVCYFVLPLSSSLATDTGMELFAGLAVVAGLLWWQIRGILRSPVPAVQAVSAIAITVPVFLILFAAGYYVMGDADASRFSEPLTRLDALYFTVTAFATVGFGDVSAVSPGARAVVTVQMVVGLLLVGVVARVIFGAVESARNRQGNSNRA